ncbi:MAG TPA: histidine kinase dimerization/phospho-acceptor domain-containing protein, partial [Thermoanaerobaculia bacterium]|nr:histidine kinase dimerization/phospho-acceptor domain-containing protein [Thermoanaerobaculia bacterium]
MSQSRPSQGGPWASLRRRLDPAAARFWGVIVPVHVVAFGLLYLGTHRLLERSYVEAGATAARVQLDRAVRELPLLVEAGRAGRNPHVFAHLIVAHRPLDLRLYRRDGSPLGASTDRLDPEEAARVRDFVVVDEPVSEVWVEERDGRRWVRGLVRLVATGNCTSCHQPGSTLGAASMRIDFTEQLAEVRGQLGRRLGLLLAGWLGAIGAVTLIVQRTVRRSGARLRADLAASVAGDASAELPTPALALDPVTAEVHRSLHEFLRRQRERESQVAHRLAHVDQLASLGQLAAGLAHEIKNPLAGIQGALELLREEAPEGETRKLYGEMLDELRRVHGILQRLLESARPAPLRLAQTSLPKLLAETAELLRPSLRRQKVELGIETAEGLPPVEIDSAK